MSEITPHTEQTPERALASARWASRSEAKAFQPGDIWLGRDSAGGGLGQSDDRHIMVVAGSRGGKGASFLVPNLAVWPGSMVVIDPKGENATITAARRGNGSKFADGLFQKLVILDPFKAAQIGDELRGSYNPLGELDPEDDETVDAAGRIADAIVVMDDGEAHWNESARSLIKSLILHVITSPDYEGMRTLVTVRNLLTQGDWLALQYVKEANAERVARGEAPLDPNPFDMLWLAMEDNHAFSGLIAGAGISARATPEKELGSILSTAKRHTEFIDSPPMKRVLSSTSEGVSLSALKTDPNGMSLFLSLPQRFMNTHFRWLRMMVSLVVIEMEKTVGLPATGHKTLLVLDEFAGLKRLEVIENAAAQIAGFGVKLVFVLQTLTQLKSVYKDNWEVFLANSGTRIFFSIEDMFTRDYISKYLGESELSRTTSNRSRTSGDSRAVSSGNNSGSSHNWDSGTTRTFGTSYSDTHTYNSGSSEGYSEGLHKRALLTPDEVGLTLARVDDKESSAYPGLAIAVLAGRPPMLLRRTNYFDDHQFLRKFDPHPDHPFIPLAAKPEQPTPATPVAGPQAKKASYEAEQLFPSLLRGRPITYFKHAGVFLTGGVFASFGVAPVLTPNGGIGAIIIMVGGMVAGLALFNRQSKRVTIAIHDKIKEIKMTGSDKIIAQKFVNEISDADLAWVLYGLRTSL